MMRLLFAVFITDAVLLCTPCAATEKLFTLPPPLSAAGPIISPILHICSAQLLFLGAVPKFFSNMACIGALIIGMHTKLKILAHRWNRILNHPLETPKCYFERMDREVRIVLDQQTDYWRQLQTLKTLVENSFFIVHVYSLYSIGSCIFVARELGMNVLTGVIYATSLAYLTKHYLWCHLVDSYKDVADAIGYEISSHCTQMPYSRQYHLQYVQMKTSLIIVWYNTINGVAMKSMGMIVISKATSSTKQVPQIENPNAKNVYNILLIGETGSGKSTLINYLTNYFNGGTLHNLKIAIPSKHYPATEGFEHQENDLQDPTKSKTGKCTMYNFSLDGVHYAFIDTPGLSDTSGKDKDAENILKIMDVAETTGTIAAIMLVVNGTVARTTKNLKDTINLMKSSVPDVLLSNLVVVLTNCSSTSSNFQFSALDPWTIEEKNKFYMNNSALSHPKKTWIDDLEKFEEIEYGWKKSMRVLHQLVKQITQLGHVTSDAFGELRKKKSEIKSNLNAHINDMKKLYVLQNKLADLQHAENVASISVLSYSNYRQNTEMEFIDTVHTSYYNVLCKKHPTNVCCNNCDNEGFWPMANCQAFRSYVCRHCGCKLRDHFEAKYKPERKTKTIEVILQETKQRYDQSKQQQATIQGQIGSLSGDLDLLKNDLDTKAQKIIDNCGELRNICSQFSFADELASAIDAMKNVANSVANLEVKADAMARIERIQDLTAASFNTKSGEQ
ncbi:hypothetical protein RP20_CCG027386 [Aedes albopictus]|nr:hypothetical protein RP20_CCG027386 [Aedes albopictus]